MICFVAKVDEGIEKNLPVEELNIDVLESLAEDLLNEKWRNLKGERF